MTDYTVFSSLTSLIHEITQLVAENVGLKKELKEYEENNPYKNGKIYKIVNTVDDKVYVGSTYQELWERRREHRKDYRTKSWPLYTHMRNSTLPIRPAPCKSRWQLDQLEYEEMKVPAAKRLFIPKRRVPNNISTAEKWRIYTQRARDRRDRQASPHVTGSDEDTGEASGPDD